MSWVCARTNSICKVNRFCRRRQETAPALETSIKMPNAGKFWHTLTHTLRRTHTLITNVSSAMRMHSKKRAHAGQNWESGQGCFAVWFLFNQRILRIRRGVHKSHFWWLTNESRLLTQGTLNVIKMTRTCRLDTCGEWLTRGGGSCQQSLNGTRHK